MTIGKRIKFIRNKKKLTQQQVADAIGTAVSYISEIERDLKIPGSKILVSLKHVLDISIDWLLTGDISPQTDKAEDVIDIRHSDVIKRFVDKEYALEINKALVALERKSKNEFYRIGGYIQAKAEIDGESLIDRRLSDRRTSSDPTMAPDGHERRGGNDRRKAAGE